MKKQDVYKKLKDSALKITSQRKAIIDLLLKAQQRLMSVEEIHEKLLAQGIKMNITTVYRNLETLEKVGLLHCTVLEDHMTYYKLSCDHGHHHHLICRCCGKIEIIDYCPLREIYPLTRQKGFFIESHKLEVYGLCKDCLAVKNQ